MVIEAQRPATHRKDIAASQAYNRRRWKFERDVLPLDERVPFVCECSRLDCLEPVELTALEYEAAHMCDDWTAVAPYHVVREDRSRVLMRHPHFWVVEPRDR